MWCVSGPRGVFVWPALLGLAVLAVVSLAYGARTALRDSADLERRAIEVRLFQQRLNPYVVPDMTYPPTALPVFTATVPAGSATVRRTVWIALNFVAIALLGWVVVRTWGNSWPWPVRFAFVLVVAACKPTRAGIALGQFHLIPTALILGAEALAAKRPTVSGLLAGLSLTKPTMSLPYLIVLAVRCRWKALGVAIALQIALMAGVSVWLWTNPITLVAEWLANAGSQLAYGTIDVPSIIGRSVPALAAWTPAITLAILAGTFGVLYALRDRSPLGLTSVATFAAAVMTYHRHYDLVLLLPALAYLIERGCQGRRGAGWTAIMFAGLVVVPSDGRLVGVTVESVYEVVFVIACYVVLGLLVREVVSEPGQPEPIRERA